MGPIKTKTRQWLSHLAFLLTAALLLALTGRVLRPAHTDYGSTWREYRCEPENSIDVLFLGSSYAYCDWNPGSMYAASGLTGYVMGGSEQTPALTYWYLKEALKTQHPSVVVMEGTSLFFDRYQNYTQINVGYMPWGVNRVGAIFDAAEPELRLGLFFDLYFYHDRWKELTPGQILRALSPARADDLKGHTAVDTVFTNLDGGPWKRDMAQSEEVYAQNLADFGRIAALCREEGVDLILTINPTYSQYTDAVYDRLRADVAAIDSAVTFVNWSNSFDQLGLDVTKHLYDGGHLNRYGAEIFSAKTGEYLLSLATPPDPRAGRTPLPGRPRRSTGPDRARNKAQCPPADQAGGHCTLR